MIYYNLILKKKAVSVHDPLNCAPYMNMLAQGRDPSWALYSLCFLSRHHDKWRSTASSIEIMYFRFAMTCWRDEYFFIYLLPKSRSYIIYAISIANNLKMQLNNETMSRFIIYCIRLSMSITCKHWCCKNGLNLKHIKAIRINIGLIVVLYLEC